MRAFAFALVLIVAVQPVVSDAAKTASLTITAAIRPDCVLTATGSIEFGKYDVAARSNHGSLDVTADAIRVACTRGSVGVTIGLGDGENGRAGHRGMAGPGASTVAYDIYTTPERATVWNQVDTVTYLPQTSRAVSVPLYGRIPAGQSVPAGRYTDILLAMVNF